ncbi:MAG: RNA-binding transcriptional accessory protein [Lachnospiraceae bacterium]|nr:RNA-binding transcriptional accessory protein [Lachnospiraceae bacterium]
MTIQQILATELGIRLSQAEAAVKLIDEGNTIPFIARYRKEATGSLNDEVLRDLFERLTYLRALEERKAVILASIESQGKLDDTLREAIEAAQTMVVLEDLYRPYKPKRVTRAQIAKKRGLEGLAATILLQTAKEPLEKEAQRYVSAEKEVPDAAAALSGAQDIIAEMISDNAEYRAHVRKLTRDEGTVKSSTKDAEAESVYEMYYDFSEAVKKIAGHRVLALNRGEAEKFLQVKILAPEEEILHYLEKQLIVRDNPHTSPLLENACRDAYSRLIAPSIEREIRSELTEQAEDGAIRVFGKNLEQLLMCRPISGKVVLGWDPAFRTGCKLAVVDATGKVLDTAVIFPTAPQNKVAEAKVKLKELIEKHGVDLISLGNGTASRESEQVIVGLIRELQRPLSYVIVDEAGASVYSASKLATEEFPQFDVGQRSAASIARRLQDPLAELVKIDPKSIGVGQYQHDMNQKKLQAALGGVVESSVNRVGVDLNTASAALLSRVSGISGPIAKNIVEYRETNGVFRDRKELLKVPKLGPKTFEQCAGFLRIRDGKQPLDATGVHPESYKAAAELLKKLGLDAEEIKKGWKEQTPVKVSERVKDRKAMARELGIGEITLADILKELEKPGRDPREDMPAPILKEDVLSMEDLTPGMVLKGTVRNIVDFGAFVDIGVHQDGLVHVSRMSDKFVKHPLEVVHVGDIVEVKVVEVDLKKKRISLSMKL